MLKHWPTESMMADNFTKPLKVSVFRKLQEEIQGIPGDMVNADLCWDKNYEYIVPIPHEYVLVNGIPMDPTLQDNRWEAEGASKEGLTTGQTNQLMDPIDHGDMNSQGNIRANRSHAYTAKCPRKLWITAQDDNE